MARPRRGRCAYQQRLRSRSSGGEDEDDEEGSDVEGGTSSDDQEVEWSQSGTASSGTASSATGGSATGGSELGGSELGGSGADESDESDGSVGPWRRVAAKCRVASTQACEDKLEKRFPEQWHEDVVVPNIKLGARVAMFTGLAYLLFFGQTMGIIHEMVCGGNHRSMFSDANSFVFYFSSFFGTAYCIRRPTLLAYKAVVFVIFVSWLVSDLFVGVDYRSFTSVLYCADVTGELTCHSCVFPSYNMMLDAMIWVLLQPSVCAKKSWMNCLFGIWMVCFCSAGVLYHRDDSVMDKYAGLFDLFVGASFLSFLEWFAVRRKRRAMRSEQLKFKLDLDHMLTTRSMYDVLKHMVPSFVIVPLLNSPACRVDVPNIERASVMFICLVGFDVQARSLTASELLGLLNRSFIEFDRVCQTHRVTKIETWMEEYVCAVGVVPSEVEESARWGHGALLARLLRAATAMLEFQPAPEADVTFKVGIHTGPVVAGVVGGKLPRFRLFGDTVNMAARMMQKGVAGQVQFGAETRGELPAWAEEQTLLRGGVEMKGKDGLVTVYNFPDATRVPLLECPIEPSAFLGPSGGAPSERSGAVARTGVLGALLLGRRARRAARDRTLRCYAQATEFDTFWRMMKTQRDESNNLEQGWRPPCLLGLCHGLAASSLEEETSFQIWFHEKVTCRNAESRLACQAVCLLSLTVVEMLYVLMGTHMSHIRDFIGYMHELRIYLLCRLACCLIVCATRLVFMHTQLGPRRSHGAGMSLSAMRRSRLFLLGSCYSVATCLFVSYDSLKPLSSFWNWEGSGHSFTDPPQLSSNVAFLVFFPVYALAITAYQFPFQYSLVWVVLTMALAWGGHHMTGLQQLKFAAGGNILVYYTMVNAIEAYCQETLLRGQHQASQRVTFTLDRIQGTLAALMPLDVIRELRESTASLTHSYPSVTLAQSDLAGFTRLASTLSPAKVVELVSELFGRLDKLTDFFEVYKVETVGDAYIAGQGGLPLTRDNSSMAVVCFALRLVEETAMWSESCGVNVGCRVGVHKAACVGGIVGTDMQRYHLFGELMTCVEILESTSHVGKVQVSRACKDAVDEEMRGRGTDVPFRFEARTDESLVTSKGETHPYEDVGGGPTYFATQ